MHSGIARFALTLGVLASLGPLIAKQLDWSPHGMHSDLWFALAVFVVAAFVEVWGEGSLRVWGRSLGGVLVIAIAAIAIPDLIESAERVGEPGTKGYFAEAARQRIFAYLLVAMSGLFLLFTGVLAHSRRDEEPETALKL